MRAKILRCVDPKTQKKDETCILCGEVKRGNKSKFEVELGCTYKAEVWICLSCSGEGASRRGSIELPYANPEHYHVKNTTTHTFWSFRDGLNWVHEFVQSPRPQEQQPGIYTIHVPERSMEFFRCEGKTPPGNDLTGK